MARKLDNDVVRVRARSERSGGADQHVALFFPAPRNARLTVVRIAGGPDVATELSAPASEREVRS